MSAICVKVSFRSLEGLRPLDMVIGGMIIWTSRYAAKENVENCDKDIRVDSYDTVQSPCD